MGYAHFKRVFLLVLSAPFALAGMGVAQEANRNSQDPGSTSLEEIVVTAQRREQSIQSVPVAVSAFSGNDLSRLGVSNNQDLDEIVPGLNTQNRGGILQPMIRGVGTTASVVGDESAVAVYIDGAYNPTSWGGLYRFFDVERIEVLRGPQGTLFGRNATGGLINVITRDPAMDGVHGDFSVAYGQFNSEDVDVYLSGPLSDTVAASIAAYYSRSDGYVTNPNLPGVDVDKSWGGGVRAKVMFTPNTHFTATLSVDYVYDDDPTPFLVSVVANSSPFALPAGPAPFITKSDIPYVSSSTQAEQRSSQASVTLRTKAMFEGFDFYSTTSYRRTTYEAVNDGDSTAFNVVLLTFDNPAENESEDARLQSSGTGPFQWIGGVFAFHGIDSLENFNYQVGTPPFESPNFNTALLIDRGEILTNAFALYGQASDDITDHLVVIAGLRYSTEQKSLDDVALDLPAEIAHQRFNNLSPKVTLQYKIDPRAMAYVTYGQAFKSGAYNPLQIADAGHPEDAKLVVAPEKIRAFEAGVKSDITPNFRANLAAFYYKYDDLQTTIDTGVVNLLQNAAKATIEGAELELLQSVSKLFSQTDKLTLSSNISYLRAVYDSYPNASVSVFNGPGLGASIVTVSASGNTLVRSPKWTENLALDYANSRSWGTVNFNLNAYFNSGFFNDAADNPLYELHSFHRLNSSLSWTSPDSRNMVALWGKNITNTTTFETPLILGAFGIVKPWDPPATFGVTYRRRF